MSLLALPAERRMQSYNLEMLKGYQHQKKSKGIHLFVCPKADLELFPVLVLEWLVIVSPSYEKLVYNVWLFMLD